MPLDYRDYLLKLMKEKGIDRDEFHRKAGISTGYARNLFMEKGPAIGKKLAERIIEGLSMTRQEQAEFEDLLEGHERRGRVAGFKALLKYVEKYVPEPQLPYEEVAELYPVGGIRSRKPVFNWEYFYKDAEQKEATLTVVDMKGNIVLERNDLGGLNKFLCPLELLPDMRYRWQVEQILVLEDGTEKRVRSPEMSFLVMNGKECDEEYALERDLRAALVLQAMKKKLYVNALRELGMMEGIMPDDQDLKRVKKTLREYIFTNPY